MGTTWDPRGSHSETKRIRKGGPPIKTLRDIGRETNGARNVLRTLAIDHGVPFDRVATGFIFSDLAAERLKRIFDDHCRKCERAGVKPPILGTREPAASA